jgi:hypothetical protein
MLNYQKIFWTEMAVFQPKRLYRVSLAFPGPLVKTDMLFIQALLFRSTGLSGWYSSAVKTWRVKETYHAISLTVNTNYLRLFNNKQLHYYENILACRRRVKHWAVNVLNCHIKSLQLQTFLNSSYPAMEIIQLRCTATHEGDSESQ